jgi:hypothetical protein
MALTIFGRNEGWEDLIPEKEINMKPRLRDGSAGSVEKDGIQIPRVGIDGIYFEEKLADGNYAPPSKALISQAVLSGPNVNDDSVEPLEINDAGDFFDALKSANPSDFLGGGMAGAAGALGLGGIEKQVREEATTAAYGVNGIIGIFNGGDPLIKVPDTGATELDAANADLFAKKDGYSKKPNVSYANQMLYARLSNLLGNGTGAVNPLSGITAGDSAKNIVGGIASNIFGITDGEFGPTLSETVEYNAANFNLMKTMGYKPSYSIKERSKKFIMSNGVKTEFHINPDKIKNEQNKYNVYKKDTQGEQIPYNTPDKIMPLDRGSFIKNSLALKNNKLRKLGYLYVRPYPNNISMNPFEIPFEFSPKISEGSVSAQYATENFLNRIGSLRTYTGSSESTISIETEYIALCEDKNQISTESKTQDVWQYQWDLIEMEKIELLYRSLVLPVNTNWSSSFGILKPPMIKILMQTDSKNSMTVGDLYRYPYEAKDGKLFIGESGIYGNYMVNDQILNLKYGTQSFSTYKTYIATDVNISFNDDIMVSPRYFFSNNSKAQGYNEWTLFNSLHTENETRDEYKKEVASMNSYRQRGFKVTLNLVEIVENYLDAVPDFRAYYNRYLKYQEIENDTYYSSKGGSGQGFETMFADLNSAINNAQISVMQDIESKSNQIIQVQNQISNLVSNVKSVTGNKNAFQFMEYAHKELYSTLDQKISFKGMGFKNISKNSYGLRRMMTKFDDLVRKIKNSDFVLHINWKDTLYGGVAEDTFKDSSAIELNGGGRITGFNTATSLFDESNYMDVRDNLGTFKKWSPTNPKKGSLLHDMYHLKEEFYLYFFDETGAERDAFADWRAFTYGEGKMPDPITMYDVWKFARGPRGSRLTPIFEGTPYLNPSEGFGVMISPITKIFNDNKAQYNVNEKVNDNNLNFWKAAELYGKYLEDMELIKQKAGANYDIEKNDLSKVTVGELFELQQKKTGDVSRTGVNIL